MLIETHIQLKNEIRPYIFNPELALYIDPEGILFAHEVYRRFAPGAYEQFVTTMKSLNMEDVLPKEP